ncbi:hypothetical protein [Massilia pseudoviolaceinigra]|uniref:hypothetical protein n=1 Tax=Massilia pseudoviolaceinigra TaxID=3057165 RepID=UPI0027967EB0|nr:hypothetical protein [Massilia sp. CCM 9206]MDQ1919745.1 hypothetical protein [Massilia sp. CCM 9206]
MNAATDKKPTITLDKKATASDTGSPLADANQSGTSTPPEKNASESLREANKALDAERTELVKNTIENIKPGKPLDLSVVREINKLETKKNRLIVARFASLLKKSGPEVQAIVHQIIEI